MKHLHTASKKLLPVELDRDEWIALLTDFIQTNFVAEGMCADVCIHDTDGHKPENEKYYLRGWLIRLGFAGTDGKEVRRPCWRG